MTIIRIFPIEGATSADMGALLQRELEKNGKGRYRLEILGGPQDVPYDAETTRITAGSGFAIVDYKPLGWGAKGSDKAPLWERIKLWFTKK